MIFPNWRAVVTGVQTQMYCLMRPGEDFMRGCGDEDESLCIPHTVVNAAGKTIYSQVTPYPVRPPGGYPPIIYNPDHPDLGIDVIKPGDPHYQYAKDGTWHYRGQGYLEAYIRITDIVENQDVRQMDDTLALACGYASAMDFWALWTDRHDRVLYLKDCRDESWDVREYGETNHGHVNRRTIRREFWDADCALTRPLLQERPAARYRAWKLTFELIDSTKPYQWRGLMEGV